MNFNDVVIVITGASKGLGKTLANILANEGAIIIGTYLSTKVKANFDTYKCDISKESDVKNLFAYVINKYHKIDAVVNCAATCQDDDYKNKTMKDFMKVVSVNLGGTFLVDKYAALNMHKGVIVNISSNEATNAYSSLSMDYSASKAGVENLTKNFAQRMPNLKICALAPAWINTESVLEMETHYLQEQMAKNNQVELLRKEDVALKIIEILINNDDYISGDIIRMEKNYE